jgi:hypothetical protein
MHRRFPRLNSPQRIATQQSSYRGARHVKPAQHCCDRGSSFLPARPAQRPPGETTTRLFSGPHPKRFWTLLGSLFLMLPDTFVIYVVRISPFLI